MILLLPRDLRRDSAMLTFGLRGLGEAGMSVPAGHTLRNTADPARSQNQRNRREVI